MPTGRRMSARAMACVGTRLGEVPPSMVPILTVTRCRVSASPVPDSGSEIGLGARDRLADDGRRLERASPRGPSAGRAPCAAGRWRWCRDGRARHAPACRWPRPRPTSGPSRRNARPGASRRRRRCWRRPAHAARASACSRCRASPCSPRRRPASARSRPTRRRDGAQAARRPAASRPCRPSCRRRRGRRACRPSARRPAAARSTPASSSSGKVSRWPLKISRRPGPRAPDAADQAHDPRLGLDALDLDAGDVAQQGFGHGRDRRACRSADWARRRRPAAVSWRSGVARRLDAARQLGAKVVWDISGSAAAVPTSGWPWRAASR